MICVGGMTENLFQFYVFRSHGGTSGSALETCSCAGKDKKKETFLRALFA